MHCSTACMPAGIASYASCFVDVRMHAGRPRLLWNDRAKCVATSTLHFALCVCMRAIDRPRKYFAVLCIACARAFRNPRRRRQCVADIARDRSRGRHERQKRTEGSRATHCAGLQLYRLTGSSNARTKRSFFVWKFCTHATKLANFETQIVPGKLN